MFTFFRPQMVELLHARDRTIAARRSKGGAAHSVYDDRSLEVTSMTEIDIDRQIGEVETALVRIGRLLRNLWQRHGEAYHRGPLRRTVGLAPSRWGSDRWREGMRSLRFRRRQVMKIGLTALTVAALATATAIAPAAVAGPGYQQIAQANPCAGKANPCAAKGAAATANPCAATNPCAPGKK